MSKTLYFAGDLFDHKHLVGNALLAASIYSNSGGEIEPVVPQDHEQTDCRAVQIRNQDLAMILESDLALFNFDGTDLDSGTVVEFMFAKFINLPSVLLRTDFRNAGDGLKDGDPWNLMATGYPRTVNVILNSMVGYQSTVKKLKRLDLELENFIDPIAGQVIRAFEEATGPQTPVTYGFIQSLRSKYINAIESAGPGFKEFLKLRWNVDDTTFDGFLDALIYEKISKGIY